MASGRCQRRGLLTGWTCASGERPTLVSRAITKACPTRPHPTQLGPARRRAVVHARRAWRFRSPRGCPSTTPHRRTLVTAARIRGPRFLVRTSGTVPVSPRSRRPTRACTCRDGRLCVFRPGGATREGFPADSLRCQRPLSRSATAAMARPDRPSQVHMRHGVSYSLYPIWLIPRASADAFGKLSVPERARSFAPPTARSLYDHFTNGRDADGVAPRTPRHALSLAASPARFRLRGSLAALVRSLGFAPGRSGHRAIRNSGPCCRRLHSSHALRNYQDTPVHCLVDVVVVAAIAIGITSIGNWVVVAFVAVVPPLVARSFWRAPEQTISESIHEARR